MTELDEHIDALKAEIRATREALDTPRAASKAHLIGSPSIDDPSGYAPGTFIGAVWRARSNDRDEQAAGKASLEALGSTFAEPDARTYLGPSGHVGGFTLPGKATLGDTGATGSYIVANNLVTTVQTIATAENLYRRLCTWVPGVASFGVDIPVEQAAPTRAIIAAFGNTKENVDIAFNRYSATLYTLARIHDVSVQLLRHSQGAAEADVVDRLGRAFGLGEAYYILSGSGTSQPKGFITALDAGPSTYTTTKNAATTTFATSIVGTVVSALQALEGRSVKADAIVLDPASFWTMLTEEESGRTYVNPQTTVGVDLTASNLSIYGIPCFRDPNMPANTGIVGNFRSARVYTGLGYRIDSSDQAGTRWDENLVGFRGEEELGFTAEPYVLAGRFQKLASLDT